MVALTMKKHHTFVGTGVPDCPFGRKCYFVTVRGVEDVDPYKMREAKRLPYNVSYSRSVGEGSNYVASLQKQTLPLPFF